jgi:hypothetical protein
MSLKQATGKPLDKLESTELWEPLGIPDVEWYNARRIETPTPHRTFVSGPRHGEGRAARLATGHVEQQETRVAAYSDSATIRQMNAYELKCCGYQFWLGGSLVAKREVQ